MVGLESDYVLMQQTLSIRNTWLVKKWIRELTMKIDQYYQEMPEERRDKALAVHRLVLELFPESKVDLS